MKFELIILILTILVIILFLIFRKSSKLINVKIGDTTVRAEIADTFLTRMKGLMFRKNMPENEGMLFIFDKEDYYSFWMMNMSMPIDMIWINSGKEVVDITKNAQPCRISCQSYQPKEKVLYVLEVNANFVDRHEIKIGSKTEFDLEGYVKND
jgi:hypothetical protein